MTIIAIVYHSGYGHTRRQSEAVLEGLEAAGATATLIAISDEGTIEEHEWEALDGAGAIVFGSPTYMGMASWQFKRFADATSKRWFSQAWRDKLAAGFTNSASMNGDKHSTLHYFITLAMQHAMVWVGTGMMPANTKASTRDDINFLGAYTGLMAQSPADAGTDEAPPAGDIATAREFGRRIAAATRALKG